MKGTPPTRSSRPESTYMIGLAGSPGALVIICTAEKSSGRRWSTPAARGASRRPWSRWCRLRPREASWSAGNAPCRGRLRPGVQNSQWPVFNDQSAVRGCHGVVFPSGHDACRKLSYLGKSNLYDKPSNDRARRGLYAKCCESKYPITVFIILCTCIHSPTLTHMGHKS